MELIIFKLLRNPPLSAKALVFLMCSSALMSPQKSSDHPSRPLKFSISSVCVQHVFKVLKTLNTVSISEKNHSRVTLRFECEH